MNEPTIKITLALAERLSRSEHQLEAGQIANMNTYMLPKWPKLHVRLVGERRTLCGREWMPGGWQFTARGLFGKHAPHGTRNDDVCKQCAANPLLAFTIDAEDYALDKLIREREEAQAERKKRQARNKRARERRAKERAA